MKKLSIIFTILCLTLSLTSMAQSPLDSTLTTSGGMTLQYPSSYIGDGDDDFSAGLINLETGIFIVIGAGDASFDFTGEEASTSEELKDSFVNTIEIFGGLMDSEPIQELSINDRPAFLVPFDTSSIGRGYFLSFELSDATLVSAMLFGTSGTEIPAEMVEDLKAIASSITIDASLATPTETTDSSDATTSAETEIEDNAEVEADDEDEIPEGAIAIADFPEGMILTGSGLQMPTLEGFTLLPGEDYVESSLGLISTNFQNSVIVVDEGEMPESELQTYIQNIIPTFALLAGNENYNVETDLQVMDVDGRTITYYSSPDLTEDDEDELSLYYFIVELLPDSNRITTVQVMVIDTEINNFDETALLEWVQSIELTEEAIIAMNAPEQVTCNATGSYVTGVDNATSTVTCPAGCDATSGTIWGTEIYTDDSSICVAAIHMGVIDETGGVVLVSYAEGQSSYASTLLNGITSSEYGEWGASFTVSAPESE